jgi:tRNA(fMet)-specific endonuclease VapC
MFVLDTDTLSRLHAGDTRIQARRARVAPVEVVTTTITRIEILQGRFDFILTAADGPQLLRALEWLDRSETLLTQITVLPLRGAAAAQFDRLRPDKKLRRIGRADLLISSIALAHDGTVVTRNLKHFGQVPGLRVESWLD